MLKLVSLNVERSKHLPLVLPFLERERADVVCVQELMEYDIPRFEETLGARCNFTPVTVHDAEGKPGRFGQAIFSVFPANGFSERFYWGKSGELLTFDFTNAATKHETELHAVSYCDVEKDGNTFRIATTHFTWTADGTPDDLQRQDMRSLIAILADLGDFVLCGDSNAPRGGEIWSELASRYKDNIPPEYKTSIDVNIHRSGKERPQELADKMVDGLFTTPGYVARGVHLEFGVSDHAAIVATIAPAGRPV